MTDPVIISADPVVVAAWIGFAAVVLGALITGFVKVYEMQKRTHDLVNSRMEKLLALTQKFARELGIEEGIEQEKMREK